MPKKLTYEDIKKGFELEGCTLLETCYINNRTKLRYICSCGNESVITWDNFNHLKQRCQKCKFRKDPTRKKYINQHSTKTKKNTQEYINRVFLDAGCECLDTYINNSIKMQYRCSCDTIAYINFNNFIQGKRCLECKRKKLSESKFGENNHMWNPNRNEIKDLDKLRKLSYTYTKRYRKKHRIIGKDKHVDHIFPIKAFYEYKIYDVDIINADDNFQVIPSSENSKKRDTYDKLLFENYLKIKNIPIL